MIGEKTHTSLALAHGAGRAHLGVYKCRVQTCSRTQIRRLNDVGVAMCSAASRRRHTALIQHGVLLVLNENTDDFDRDDRADL